MVSDLTSAFYQIPLAKESMKFCGVATPFRGVRVYARCAMGMPGSETPLEELMCRVLGDLLQEGVVIKLADDLYCGGNSPQELLHNWSRVLDALDRCNLRLFAPHLLPFLVGFGLKAQYAPAPTVSRPCHLVLHRRPFSDCVPSLALSKYWDVSSRRALRYSRLSNHISQGGSHKSR